MKTDEFRRSININNIRMYSVKNNIGYFSVSPDVSALRQTCKMTALRLYLLRRFIIWNRVTHRWTLYIVCCSVLSVSRLFSGLNVLKFSFCSISRYESTWDALNKLHTFREFRLRSVCSNKSRKDIISKGIARRNSTDYGRSLPCKIGL